LFLPVDKNGIGYLPSSVKPCGNLWHTDKSVNAVFPMKAGNLSQSGFYKLAMGDNRRFDLRCGGRCDERQATCDVRATIDASTHKKKNSQSTKATVCQKTDSPTYLPGEKSVC
jgi:hypothetical protein